MKIKTSNQNIKSRFLSTLAITIIILSMIPVAQSIEISCERYEESENIANTESYNIKYTQIFIGRIKNLEIKDGLTTFDAVNLIMICKASVNDEKGLLLGIFREELGPYSRITTLESFSIDGEKSLSFNINRRESDSYVTLSFYPFNSPFKGILTHNFIFGITRFEHNFDDEEWIGPDEIPNLEFLKTTLANH